MNSLPLISHHLFVAALENQGHAGGKPAAEETAMPNESRRARPISLELVAEVGPLSGGVTRPLCASPAPRDT